MCLDQVLVLAEGRQLYQGPVEEAMPYFASHGYEFSERANPADTLLDIAARRTGSNSSYIGITETSNQRLAHMWSQHTSLSTHTLKQNIQAGLTTTTTSTTSTSTSASTSTVSVSQPAESEIQARGASRARQTYLCFQRAMKQQLRQPTSLLLEISVGGIAGLLIGLGIYPYQGHHFQGVYHAPFAMLSSAVDYTTVPKAGQMIAMAIAVAAAAPGVNTFGEESELFNIPLVPFHVMLYTDSYTIRNAILARIQRRPFTLRILPRKSPLHASENVAIRYTFHILLRSSRYADNVVLDSLWAELAVLSLCVYNIPHIPLHLPLFCFYGKCAVLCCGIYKSI